MRPFAKHPSDGDICPKCRSYDGWLVVYHERDHNRMDAFGVDAEHLDWRCNVCGYEIQTSTADAAVPVA